jgi:hypothetical protein
MTLNILTRLSSAEAQEKAEECHALAKKVKNPEHRSMLARMAETWQQISHRLERNDPPQFRPGPH